LKLFSWACMS